MIEISDTAIREFKRILDDEKNGKAIRLFSSGGGCCGPSLGMDMVAQGEEGDVKYVNEECPVFIEKRAFDELNGAVIDFSNEGAQKGFFLRGLRGGC